MEPTYLPCLLVKGNFDHSSLLYSRLQTTVSLSFDWRVRMSWNLRQRNPRLMNKSKGCGPGRFNLMTTRVFFGKGPLALCLQRTLQSVWKIWPEWNLNMIDNNGSSIMDDQNLEIYAVSTIKEFMINPLRIWKRNFQKPNDWLNPVAEDW